MQFSRLLITNHDELFILKEEVGHCLKNLARELNFNGGKIEMISLEEKEDRERCSKALERWWQDNGEEATIRELNKSGLADVNKNVINCLKLTRNVSCVYDSILNLTTERKRDGNYMIVFTPPPFPSPSPLIFHSSSRLNVKSTEQHLKRFLISWVFQ